MRTTPPQARMARMQRTLAIACLVVCSAIGAELLAAYDDTTGRPLALLGSLVFFALLYGCPALLLREYARRTGRGWPAMITLSAAAGLLQAGVLDQSLFAEHYDDVRGWEEWFRATAIAPLGISAYLAQNFLVGHIVYSFCAPIALVEASFPAVAHRPLLGRPGIVITFVLWALVAAAIFADAGEATPVELTASLLVVVGLVLAATRLPPADRGAARPAGPERGVEAPPASRRRGAALRPAVLRRGAAPRASRRRGAALGRAVLRRGAAPRASRRRGAAALAGGAPGVAAASFVAAGVHALMPDDWPGTAAALLIVAGSGLWLLHVARSGPWGLRESAAVAAGVLVSRGALAFTYFPLVGHTPAAAKYAHNVVMLALVVGLAVYAARRSGAARFAAG